jgi:uncharacterized protein (DUF2252 family)
MIQPFDGVPPRFAASSARRAFGRGRRKEVPRRLLAEVHGGERRPPLEILAESERGRLKPLLRIKHERMAASPFAFFRGSAPVMASDFALLPTTGIPVQICGDAHLRNFGAFAAPDGHLVFDVNDFDETMVGPWEWDLKRLAVSAVLAGRECGLTESRSVDVARAVVRSYRCALADLANLTAIELLRYDVRRESRSSPVSTILDQARRATPAYNLKKLTTSTARGPQFHDKPPLLHHVGPSLRREVLSSLDAYARTVSEDRRLCLAAYTPVDVSFKLVGTGSVGLRDYVVLCLGASSDDALFLQIKEELPSCYSPYLNDTSSPVHQGNRVAGGQQRMQTACDPFLGWTSIHERQFLVRQLADHKAALDLTKVDGGQLNAYAVVCAEVLAKAHARTGDPVVLSAYCGNSERLDEAISAFAKTYAAQVMTDYKAFLARYRPRRTSRK